MMSAFFHGSRPMNPGSTYAAQSSSSASRGRRRTALWATMAGVGRFTRVECVTPGGRGPANKKGSLGCLSWCAGDSGLGRGLAELLEELVHPADHVVH